MFDKDFLRKKPKVQKPMIMKNTNNFHSRLGKQLVEIRALSGRRKNSTIQQNYVTGKTTAPSSINNQTNLPEEEARSSNGSSLCNYEKGANAGSLFTDKESKATTK